MNFRKKFIKKISVWFIKSLILVNGSSQKTWVLRLLKSLENLKKHVIDHNIVPIDHNIIPWVQNCSLTRSGSIDYGGHCMKTQQHHNSWHYFSAVCSEVPANNLECPLIANHLVEVGVTGASIEDKIRTYLNQQFPGTGMLTGS